MSVNQKAGRTWSYGEKGLESVTRIYQKILETPIAAGFEGAAIEGVPAYGAAHPLNADLIATKIDYAEGKDGDKIVITATVTYEPKKEAEEPEGAVEKWGWDAGTDSRELTVTADNKNVVNSAGDPFQSVPQYNVYCPTFTKVMKFDARQDCLGFNCQVNAAALTIGGRSFAAKTLLCSVSEEHIIGDSNYKYRYTVNLKYRENWKRDGAQAATGPTNVGWDELVVDAGMRQKDVNDATGKKKVLIRMRDGETGRECVVQSPALLDGNGYKISDTDPDPNARLLQFSPYKTATFPAWFVSEPDVAEPEEEEDDD